MTLHEQQRLLVLGAGGMLGNAIFRFFAADARFVTYGTLRDNRKRGRFSAAQQANLLTDIDIEHERDLVALFAATRPDVVINCIGIIKQIEAAQDPVLSLAINAMLPHRLAGYCQMLGARLIHFSTDCVFSGARGNYTEADIADASDLYGRTKLLGEVATPGTLTLRTSIIGRELSSAHSLIDWFLRQEGAVKGYRKAVFSGLPTIEVARVIRDFVLPTRDLSGLYHLAATPISKHDLLQLVGDIYGKPIRIDADDALVIDRSLNAERLQNATGYRPPTWPDLIAAMHRDTVG